MTVLFAGSELDAFSPSDGAVTEVATGAVRYDGAFSRGCLKIGGNGGVAYAESAVWSGQAELYYHFACHTVSFFGTYDTFALCDGTDPIFKIVSAAPSPGNGTFQMYYKNGGGTWTAIGGAVPFSNALTHFDVYLKIDVAGVATLFSAGTEMTTGSADLSHLSTVDRARHYANYSHNYISQCIASTEPTIGKRVMTAYPSGAGSTSAWTGDYTTVDEAITSDADFINSATATQVETMGVTPAGSMTGYTASAVIVSARAKRGGSGPQNLQVALRSSGTDYFTGNLALGVGYAPKQGIWETDPATTAAWINAAVLAAQPGVKSIT